VVAIEVNMMIEGDIVVGLWRGECKGPWDAPSCAYVFHTAFADAGVLRVTAADMDFPDSERPAPAPSDPDFCMEVALMEPDIATQARRRAHRHAKPALQAQDADSTSHVCEQTEPAVQNLGANRGCRPGRGGAMDVEQLRLDWLAMVSGGLAQVPSRRVRGGQSARVLEEMLPFVRAVLPPSAIALSVSSLPQALPSPATVQAAQPKKAHAAGGPPQTMSNGTRL
jgi:hypothetical protein